MWVFKYKTVLLAATATWILLILYLFFSIGNVDQHRRDQKVHVALKWAKDLLKNYSGISLSADNATTAQQPPADLSVRPQVVMSADAEALGGLVAAVNSVLSHTDPTRIHFYFVIPESIESHLREWMQVKPLNQTKYTIKTVPNEQFDSRLTKGIFLNYFPELRGKIIYLDSDVIVQGDITELYESRSLDGTFGLFSEDCHSGSNRIGLNLENRYAGRVNLKSPAIKQLQKEKNVFFNPAACVFSTGVFVTSDLDYWRKNDVAGSVEKLVNTSRKDVIVGPQGNDPVEAALLALLYKQTTKLDPMWHVRNLGMTTGSRYSASFLREAKLLHWNGHFKPWSRRGPEQQIWDEYFVPDPRGKFKPVRKG